MKLSELRAQLEELLDQEDVFLRDPEVKMYDSYGGIRDLESIRVDRIPTSPDGEGERVPEVQLLPVLP